MLPSASEIAERGYGIEIHNKVYDNRAYFCALLSAIITEYFDSGRCNYVDRKVKEMKQNHGEIDLIEASVLTTLRDVLKKSEIPGSQYHTQNGFQIAKWTDSVKRGGAFFRLSSDVVYDIQSVARLLKEFENFKQSEAVFPNFGGNRSSSSRFGKNAGIEEAEAQKRADRITEDAQRRADEIVSKAQQDADKLREDAQKDAQKQKEDIIQAAYRQAAKIRNEAHQQATAIHPDSSLHRFWQEHQSNVLREVGEVLNQDNEAAQEAMVQINDTHDKMCAATNDLKAHWQTSLDTAIQQLKGMQDDLDTKLREWQKALYPRELRPIANCYVQLHVLIDRSGAIVEELTERSAGAKDDLNSRSDACSSKTLDQLERLRTNLIKFQTQFEKSMGGLGLYAFSPSPGTPFDDCYHESFADQDLSGPLKVKSCRRPGVMRRTKAGEGEEEVIILAEVELEAQ